MASITQLFDDLCEAFLPAAEAHLGQRDGSRRRAKRSLRRAAYGALLPRRPRDAAPEARPEPPRRAVRNEILMLSFDLRVGGQGPEADRLEALVELLAETPGRAPEELDPVLDLLVRLAGSGPPQARAPRRDYAFHSKHVGRSVPYSGYDCAGLSVFERDVQSQIRREECLCQDVIQKTLQVMEAAPGAGLRAGGLFSAGDPCGDRFERDTRLSLFGALVHSRTWDMDVRLDLPPVPASAALSGLAIKVPRSVDPSEDEGFQSASNLTPDSQSELGLTPDVDLWDAALTYKASKRRCWEQVGCPPGHREEPYLTEAGRDAFDSFCRLRHGELQVLGGGLLQTPPPVLLTESELVKDALNVLIGVVSTTFSLCQLTQVFVAKRGVHVSGASPESVSSLLSELAEHGTHYSRLSRFSVQPALDTSSSRGLVLQAFTSGLRRYLQYYRACVLSTPPTLSLLTLSFLFKRLGRQLRYLAELCGVGPAPLGAGEEPRAAFPSGVKLLSYLYQEALDNCSNEHYPVLLSLLKTSCEPYTRFIHDWVYSGVFRDLYGEFMIQVNPEYLGSRDKSYWTRGYVLLSEAAADGLPAFLRHVAQDVYVCGKTVNLLRLCCPRHYLCWSDVPVPPISVTFSLEELKRVEQECAVYVGRVEGAARLSSVSREQEELRTEIAKQELVVQAREAASRALRVLSDRQASERAALDARKREQFQRLREQLAQDQERRQVARQEELEQDLGCAQELRDRGERPQALEQQRERTTRWALAEPPGQPLAEAMRLERLALWRAQRRRLDGARQRFLQDEEERVQGMLRGRSAGSPPEQPALPPSTDSQGPSLGPGPPDAAWDCMDAPRPPLPLPASAGTCTQGLGSLPETLPIQDFMPGGGGVGHPLPAGGAPVLEAALRTIGSDLSPPAPPIATGPQPPEPQEYDFGTVLRPAEAAAPPPGPLQTAGGGGAGQLPGSPEAEPDQCVPSMLPHPCPLRSDPCPRGMHQTAGQPLGPVSDGSVPNRPRWRVHGHVSDASVNIGENVWDVAPSRPRWSVHGHVSQSHVVLGVLPGETQPHGPLHTPFPSQSPPDLKCPGPQSPAPGAGPEPAAHAASGGAHFQEARPGPGEGCSPQGSPHAEATPRALGSGPREPGPVSSGDTEARPPAQIPGTQRSPGPEAQEEPELQEAAAWRREQAYLAGLARQYCLERYPDSYVSMSEPPLARLLHHGLPRAFTLPEDPGRQADPDETVAQLSELLPLPVLMKHSLMAPLAAHVSLVNKAAVDHFFVELRLEAHLEALRHFLLMEDGEFAQSLSDLLFEKLGAGQTPGELLTPLALNGLLSKALQYSLHGRGPLASRLSFALKFLPEAFAPNAPDVLSCLELRYKVDWPLNIVITEGCLSRYSGICSFLLQLKLMMWTLKDVCFHLKRTALVSQAAGSAQFRQLQLFKHEMQHFVKVIQGYIANQILHVTWCEFRARLARAGDLEEVQRAHAEYLHRAVFRGLLTEKAAPVMNIIHSVFSLVLKFRSQLISQPWGPAHGPRGAEHPNFALMQQSYSTFKYYSHFLFKVVTKLVNRGYQPHLEDFLLRINFNDYYQEA